MERVGRPRQRGEPRHRVEAGYRGGGGPAQSVNEILEVRVKELSQSLREADD